MMGGPGVLRGLLVWLGLLGLGLTASAQEFARENLPPFAKARLHEVVPPDSEGKFHFGIMGQVARPGVYELAQPEVQILELIRHAGGLTRQATNQLRIVRQGNARQQAYYDPSLSFVLIPGDIVVADGPLAPHAAYRLSKLPAASSEIHTADFVELALGNDEPEPVPVALMGVLDRPVILPVPPTHANVPAVVRYLGQDAGLAARVKVLPVGPRGADSETGNGTASPFVLPCVLYFNPRQILAHSLPKFPDVYRPQEPTLSLPNAEERKTADILLAPSTLPALSMPIPHSEVGLPAPSSFPSEPPMISALRKLEQQIPSPERAKPQRAAKAPPPGPTPRTEANLAGEDAGGETSSWWPYLGWVLIGLAGAGVYARLRRPKTSPDPSAEMFVPVLAEESQSARVPEATRHQPVNLSPHIALDEDILSALVFNQLPIVEETQEPFLPEETPAPRKTFRVDPPQELSATVTRKPYIHSRLKPIPAEESPVQTAPKKKKGPRQSQSLLDRALKRASERKAA